MTRRTRDETKIHVVIRVVLYKKFVTLITKTPRGAPSTQGSPV